MLNSNISTCLHNTVNVGPLTAETGWWIWCTPANFNGVRVLASLLKRRRSTEVNQTLHDVWPSAGLVYHIYILRGLLLPNGILSGAKFTLRPSLAFSCFGRVTARTGAVGVSQTLRHGTNNEILELSLRIVFYRGRHLFLLWCQALFVLNVVHRFKANFLVPRMYFVKSHGTHFNYVLACINDMFMYSNTGLARNYILQWTLAHCITFVFSLLFFLLVVFLCIYMCVSIVFSLLPQVAE